MKEVEPLRTVTMRELGGRKTRRDSHKGIQKTSAACEETEADGACVQRNDSAGTKAATQKDEE